MKVFQIKGVSQMLSKLKGSTNTMQDKASAGLRLAGLFLQRESQKIVPVQTGHLKNTAFTRKTGQRLMTDVTVGYTAKYATYVHEDLDKAHGQAFNVKHADEIANAGKWSSSLKTKKTTFKPKKDLKKGTAASGMFPRGENQQAKFLETPGKQKRLEMLAIIAAEIK